MCIPSWIVIPYLRSQGCNMFPLVLRQNIRLTHLQHFHSIAMIAFHLSQRIPNQNAQEVVNPLRSGENSIAVSATGDFQESLTAGDILGIWAKNAGASIVAVIFVSGMILGRGIMKLVRRILSSWSFMMLSGLHIRKSQPEHRVGPVIRTS